MLHKNLSSGVVTAGSCRNSAVSISDLPMSGQSLGVLCCVWLCVCVSRLGLGYGFILDGNNGEGDWAGDDLDGSRPSCSARAVARAFSMAMRTMFWLTDMVPKKKDAGVSAYAVWRKCDGSYRAGTEKVKWTTYRKTR
jgi:hypothetical protein